MNLNDIITQPYNITHSRSADAIINISQNDFEHSILLPDLYKALVENNAYSFQICIPNGLPEAEALGNALFTGYTHDERGDIIIYLHETEHGYRVEVAPPLPF